MTFPPPGFAGSAFRMGRSAAGRPARGRVSAWVALLALFMLLAQPATTRAQGLPALTGRVVDAANLLTPEQRGALEAKLKAHEDKSTDQVVVATVPSLGGSPVEDYANRLYRAWGLGTKEKNNGALLLVAPADRKVRIEVGYGLEGALTDAITGVIIRTAIAPRFRDGDFAGGIDAGVTAMLSVLAGDAEEWGRRAKVKEDPAGTIDIALIVVFIVIFVVVIGNAFRARAGGVRYHRGRGGAWLPVPIPSGGGWSGGGWSGGGGFSGGGGGFFGGGGSSGGGGASGSW
ncbi:MAG: hypothetical protein JWR08_467 [Enterovirga sp.]|nr:hypothetical protein [Enterovirga sp.]